MRKAVAGLFGLLAGVTEFPNQRQFDNFAKDIMAFRGLAYREGTLQGNIFYGLCPKVQWAYDLLCGVDELFVLII